MQHYMFHLFLCILLDPFISDSKTILIFVKLPITTEFQKKSLLLKPEHFDFFLCFLATIILVLGPLH